MSNVKEFGAVGDGATDDTQSIRHALADGDGVLHFPRGIYRLTETVEIPLGQRGPAGVSGDHGAATLRMHGPGPALRLAGNHNGTGDPGSVRPGVGLAERMPVLRDLAIEGAHPEADGVELHKTLQARLEGLLLRDLRHGLRLVARNRNLIVAHCHIYHNTGVGVWFDGVNLHQVNLVGNHISYNRLGRVRVERSEVRNLQITGNDIEYNNARSHPGLPSEPSAELWIDTSTPGASVSEVTIASNTIQATASTGGANIRIVETPDESRPPGLWAITGNVIGSQHNNVHLTGAYGVTISGNTIYSCVHRNLLAERCGHLLVGQNLFRHHTKVRNCGVRLEDCHDCVIQGCLVHDAHPGGQPSGASLLEIERCRGIQINGCQLHDGAPHGLDINDCQRVLVSACTIREARRPRAGKSPIRVRGEPPTLHGNLVESAEPEQQ